MPSWAGSPASPCMAPEGMQDAPFGGGWGGFPHHQHCWGTAAPSRDPSGPLWDFGSCKQRLSASTNFALLSSLPTPRAGRDGKQQRNDSLAASSGKGIYSFFMENSLGSAPRHCPRMQLLSLRPQRGWESLTWPGCDAFHGLGVEITAGIVGLLGQEVADPALCPSQVTLGAATLYAVPEPLGKEPCGKQACPGHAVQGRLEEEPSWLGKMQLQQLRIILLWSLMTLMF